MSGSGKMSAIGYAFLVVLGLVAPLVLYPIFLMQALCFALFACAFNLLMGVAVKLWGLPPEIGLLVGTAAAALLGYLIGSLAIRRQGIYFAMITLALAQMLYFFCLQAKFTGGEDGLQGVPRGHLLGFINLENDLTLYYFVFAIFVLGFCIIHRAIDSPFGQVLTAIRENEPRALSLGYDVDKYKLLAFVLSAALSGLAGSTKTLVLGFETLTDVHWHMSGEVVLMTLLGGMGTVLGPVVGAFIVKTLENRIGEFGQLLANQTGVEWFRTIGDSVTIVTGLIFVICVLAFRRGIVGELIALFRKQRA